jgi:hypothetical protein
MMTVGSIPLTTQLSSQRQVRDPTALTWILLCSRYMFPLPAAVWAFYHNVNVSPT